MEFAIAFARELDDDLLRLLASQEGLATRRQLLEQGVTRAALRWRLDHGWSAVAGPVVATAAGPLTERGRALTGQLVAGPLATVTADHACLRHGLRSARGNRPVRMIVPMNQAARQVGFVDVRRSRRPVLEPRTDGLLRIAHLPRAVIDAALAATTVNEARSLVIEATQRRLATVEQLQHELEVGPRRGRRLARQALDDARAGAWSPPEAELLHLCATSAVLPRAIPNPSLSVAGRTLLSPDLWFDDVAMAVMVHSREHHARDADWERTVEGDGTLAAHGVLVLGFTPRSIGREPRQVLRRIEQAYLQAERSGRRRPPIDVNPRFPGLPR